nr:MAG TPA: hypothetical protein [Caudoviricetes sp.]
MGGRGSSSGISGKGRSYGSQYHTLYEYENIKFVSNTGKNYEPLMETQTAGRVYVQVGGKDIVRIVFMGDDAKRNKVIEQDKRSKEWHVHHGYFHTENSEKDHEPLTVQDRQYLEKVKRIWHNHIKQA